MENNVEYYHNELQKYIHIVEEDEKNTEALDKVKEMFLAVFDIIKMIMISRQERYYGLFLIKFELKSNFTAYYDAGVSIDSFPFRMTVNPLLIGLKTLAEMIYIFCHEIEHIVLNHPVDGIKYNPKKDPSIGFKLNIAMDASINDRLTADNKKNKFNIIKEPEDAVTSEYLQETFGIHIKSLQAFDYYFERIPEDGSGGGNLAGISIGEVIGENEIITEAKRKNITVIHCIIRNVLYI